MEGSHKIDVLCVLRSRAKALGYDIYGVDHGGYVLARRHPGYRREIVLGKDGGVTLDAIERWLEDNHPDPEFDPA
jgi:hypothetical protein